MFVCLFVCLFFHRIFITITENKIEVSMVRGKIVHLQALNYAKICMHKYIIFIKHAVNIYTNQNKNDKGG